jgi:hypothetical protein
VLRRHLIDRHAEMRLGATLRHRTGQKHRRGARVIGTRGHIRSASPGHKRMRQAADDVDVRPMRLERLQDLGERESAPVLGRRPLVHRRAMRHVDRGEARAR